MRATGGAGVGGGARRAAGGGAAAARRGARGGRGGLSRHLPARAAHFFFLRLKKQQHLEYTDCLHDDLQSLSGY